VHEQSKICFQNSLFTRYTVSQKIVTLFIFVIALSDFIRFR